MSTPELITQVQEALAKIPHEAWCGDHSYGLTRHSCDCLYEMRCSCDREARIAEAVARAIDETRAETERQCQEQGIRPVWSIVGKLIYDAALEALGASPQPET